MTEYTKNPLRAALYVSVIVAAMTVVREPWMAALQGAVGGFALGAWVRAAVEEH